MLSERPHGPLLLEASGVLLEQISQERSGGVGRHGGRACVRLCGCEGGALSDALQQLPHEPAAVAFVGVETGVPIGPEKCSVTEH